MNVADIIGLIALLTKIVDTLRYGAGRNMNAVVTQMVAWAIGIGGVVLVAQTSWAAHIAVGNGGSLASQPLVSLVAIGLALSSSGSVLNDLRSAVDNTNTAIVPPLVGKWLATSRGVVDTAATTPIPGGVRMVSAGVVRELEAITEHLHRGGSVAVVPPAGTPPQTAT